MLKITDYVMRFAPLAVFAAVAAAIADAGPRRARRPTASSSALLSSASSMLWVVLIGVRLRVPRAARVRAAVRYIREPMMLAFSTARSEAAYPEADGALDRFGVQRRGSPSFVLPLGYSFNLDGSMMYMTFAALFIAQAYGIDLSLGQQITMLLVLMMTSKGIAGVPRASLVVIAATLPMFGMPEAGLLLILRHRPLPRHGPHGDQRRRQCGRDRRGREMGRRARAAAARGIRRGIRRSCACVHGMKRYARSLVALAMTCAIGAASATAPEWTDALSGRLGKSGRRASFGWAIARTRFPSPMPARTGSRSATRSTSATRLWRPSRRPGRPRAGHRLRAGHPTGSHRGDLGRGRPGVRGTTNHGERREVAFSPVIFVTRDASHGAAWPQVRPPTTCGPFSGSGRRHANEAAIRESIACASCNEGRRRRRPTVTLSRCRRRGRPMRCRRRRARAGHSLISRHATDVRLVGEMLSYEPYGIMFPAATPRSPTPWRAPSARWPRAARSSGSTTAGSCGRCRRASGSTCR